MTKRKYGDYLDPALRQYVLDHRMQGHSLKTLKCRRELLAQLSRYLGKPILEADEEALLRWYYQFEGATTWTKITYARTVRSYFRWGIRRGHITHDPSLALPVPRPPAPNPNPLTAEEVRAALDNAEPRIRMFLILSAGAGLRAVEISRMRREDLSNETGRWVLSVPLGKGNKPRAMVVSDWVAAEICAWRSTSGRMFNLTPPSVSNLANAYLHSIGITRTLHRGRAAFATTFYEATRDLLATAEVLGHSSVQTVTHYTRAAPTSHTVGLAAIDTLLRGKAA